MSGALQAVFQNQRSFGPPPGQQAYTTPGCYTWVAPAGVTNVSVVVVGAGSPGIAQGNNCCSTAFRNGGSGGALSYKNNYGVTPGGSYSVKVGCTGQFVSPQCVGRRSFFVSQFVVSANSGCVRVGCGGGCGGIGGFIQTGSLCGVSRGGGGAAGYSGNGGAGGTSATGGSGGGGGGSTTSTGGGVGILGQGSSGGVGNPGSGGSGKSYGGGASSGTSAACYSTVYSYNQGTGAVRIIWPGSTRSFPSTCTGDL